MATSYMNVRVPSRLKKEAEILVHKGYFKNLSDLLVEGVRSMVLTYNPSDSVKRARRIRRQIWSEHMRKAKGDKRKAADLYFEELKRLEQSDPFFRS